MMVSLQQVSTTKMSLVMSLPSILAETMLFFSLVVTRLSSLVTQLETTWKMKFFFSLFSKMTLFVPVTSLVFRHSSLRGVDMKNEIFFFTFCKNVSFYSNDVTRLSSLVTQRSRHEKWNFFFLLFAKMTLLLPMTSFVFRHSSLRDDMKKEI